MSEGWIEKILFLLAGGFFGALFTFLFTIWVKRLQRRQPNVEWLKFPEVHLTREGLSAVSWVIENNGRKAAEDVAVVIQLPQEASFISFDSVPSEKAMSYTVTDVAPNKRSFVIPHFNSGISLSISGIIENLASGQIDISVVGKDVVGSEKKLLTDAKLRSLEALMNKISIATCGLISLFVILACVAFVFVTTERIRYDRASTIADLQMSVGDQEGALKTYKSLQSNSFVLRYSPSVYYKIAVTHAAMGDTDSSVLSLKEAISRQAELGHAIKTDPAFKKIRQTKVFTDFVASLP